jgi:hypothetical protein
VGGFLTRAAPKSAMIWVSPIMTVPHPTAYAANKLTQSETVKQLVVSNVSVNRKRLGFLPALMIHTEAPTTQLRFQII